MKPSFPLDRGEFKIVENPMLLDGTIMVQGRTIYVQSLYPYYFMWYDDFDEALDHCVEHAKKKVDGKVDAIFLRRLELSRLFHEPNSDVDIRSFIKEWNKHNGLIFYRPSTNQGALGIADVQYMQSQLNSKPWPQRKT